MLVCCHVDVWNQTLVLCKEQQVILRAEPSLISSQLEGWWTSCLPSNITASWSLPSFIPESSLEEIISKVSYPEARLDKAEARRTKTTHKYQTKREVFLICVTFLLKNVPRSLAVFRMKVNPSEISWLVLLSTGHNQNHMGRKSLNWVNIACSHVCETSSWLMIGIRGPAYCGWHRL